MNDSAIWSLAKRVDQFLDDGMIEIAKKDFSEIETHIFKSNDSDLKLYVNELFFKIHGYHKEDIPSVKDSTSYKEIINPAKSSYSDNELGKIGQDIRTIKNIMIFFLIISILSIMLYLYAGILIA